ncbi:MAG: hypothetical protein CMJ78_15555 [Planctomycetaceae bacterium]|nr:hypothetical protein [Planctomycetaceae bacterium]
MARKTPSRLELRKQVEAAEAEGAPAKKKKVTRKKTTRAKRTREKTPERKKLVWGVFSGSMKEEARFAYEERDAAEEKLEQLRSKGKKLYFIQPIKVVITEPVGAADDD